MKKEARHATLYRTYRPATFKEVRGQAQVVDVLAKAIKNNKPAHRKILLAGLFLLAAVFDDKCFLWYSK